MENEKHRIHNKDSVFENYDIIDSSTIYPESVFKRRNKYQIITISIS